MPHLRIETNVPEANIPKDLPAKLCQVLAKSLGKPVSYCVATVVGGVNMSWGGSTVPCAQATLMSIGALGVEPNKKHSAAIFEVITKELGIADDKMYIHFMDAPSANVGFQGTTFKDILG
ncbi:D-dopachrome decarboxylase-A [Aethina tumida]|uniref:D-dopachrome decarboxylase-A n=1 Tax=Aethina tumida TaxID=116153 RepID=UPI00096AFA91|nr:D-dopachrome decarboxylase-A [Aethina tumida]